jgi:hypothetical protein
MTKYIQARVIPLREYPGVELLVRDPETGNHLAHDASGTPYYQVVEPGEYSPVSLILRDEDAQALANSLWNAGFRPEGSRASAGQLDATQAHLADMRAMAFQGLKLQKP